MDFHHQLVMRPWCNGSSALAIQHAPVRFKLNPIFLVKYGFIESIVHQKEKPSVFDFQE